MEPIGKIINKMKLPNTIINDNNVNILNNVNNDTNDNVTKKHALDRSKFIPNTEGAVLAEKIASTFNDLQNYACYLYVVNKIGVMDAERLLCSTINDIDEKKNTKYPVRNKAKYFMYKFKFKKY